MKDNRKILHGVVIGDRTITDPDELQKVMTPEMQKRFEDAGSIEGDWKKGKSKTATDENDLSQKTVPELKEMAVAKGIEGADSMKKAELIDALNKE
jgi:large subunit ribosomal protein L21